MKWTYACLILCFVVAPAMAGEDPYVAIVGNDWFDANRWYLSERQQNFLYNWEPITAPRCSTDPGPGRLCEDFSPRSAKNQPEVCDPNGYVSWYCDEPGSNKPYCHRGNLNALTPAGSSGSYRWWIRLPKKPSGQINIVIQCGVLTPNAFAAYGFSAVRRCAAETGERVGPGVCTRQEVDPSVSPVTNTALPTIKALAIPGPYNDFDPFYLTAFKNPGAYVLNLEPVIPGLLLLNNDDNVQALDGGTNARIMLKACMDTTIVVKLPVAGQVNFQGATEVDLVAGDGILIDMEVPRQNTVDIYCHAQSVRLDGVGEAPF